MLRSLLLIWLLLFASLSELSASDQWVEQTLRKMSTEEKVGQLFIVELLALHSHRESPEYQYAEEMVRQYHVGGFILAAGTVSDIALSSNRLQKISRIPLLINADLEAGLNVAHPWRWNRGWTDRLPAYVSGGGTAFPWPMAIGCAGRPEYAYESGRITALEAKAVGIKWTNSPVADVNNNPANPVVNARSFGEDPRFVGRMVAEYVRGVQSEGVLATLKHFPGHGDTEQDSHMGLPVLPFDEARLDSVELVPFKAGIDAGAKCVMIGHLALPRIDSTGRPATLSRKLVSEILRGRLGFSGLVVTDAMRMQGITDAYGSGEAAVLALEAGVDVVLIPYDVDEVFRTVLAAVRGGRISARRLDESVRRILGAKAWTGLHRNRYVDLARVPEVVGDPRHERMASQISDSSVVLLRNDGVIPVMKGTKVRVVFVSEEQPPGSGLEFQRVLASRLGEVPAHWCTNETGEERIAEIREGLRDADLTIVALFLSIRAWKGATRFSPPIQALLGGIGSLAPRVVTVSFGDPYVLSRIPHTDAILTPCNGTILAERSVAKALLGEFRPSGRLPVTLR